MLPGVEEPRLGRERGTDSQQGTALLWAAALGAMARVEKGRVRGTAARPPGGREAGGAGASGGSRVPPGELGSAVGVNGGGG